MKVEELLKSLINDNPKAKKTVTMHVLVDKAMEICEEAFNDMIEGDDNDQRVFMVNFAINLFGNIVKKYSPKNKEKFTHNFKKAMVSLEKWHEKVLQEEMSDEKEEDKHCGNPKCEAHD